jgi:hypothetical protein
MNPRDERLAWLAVGVLTVIVALVRLAALRASPFPTGVDGYWYLIEVRSLLEHGRLHYPTAPLVPSLMALVALAVEPILAVKLVAAFGSAALILPSYAIARRVSGSVGAALLGAALVATSAQSFFLSTEFVKQAVGLPLALGCVAILADATVRPTKARLGTTGLALLACALAHKTSLGLAVLLGAPIAVQAGWRLRRRRLFIAASAATLGAMLGGALLLATGAPTAPLRHLFTAHASLGFAVLAAPGGRPLVLGHEVALAAALALAVAAHAILRPPIQGPRLPPLLLGFVGLAWFLALPWLDVADDQGLGYRLRLCASVCLAPCAAVFVARLLRGANSRLRGSLVALATSLWLLGRPWTSAEGVVKAHPAMVEATSRLAGILPPDATVVVPERHTAFMAAWYARASTRLRPPTGADPARTFRLLPGAEIRPGLWAALDELRARPVAGIAPSVDLHSLHPNGLVLLSESTFQYLIARLPSDERLWYRIWVVQ